MSKKFSLTWQNTKCRVEFLRDSKGSPGLVYYDKIGNKRYTGFLAAPLAARVIDPDTWPAYCAKFKSGITTTQQELF